MDLEETKVRLNAGAKDRIAALVGRQRMATFIREAVEEKLSRDEGQEPATVRARPTRKPAKPDDA